MPAVVKAIKRNGKTGFTLIEVLIVIVIIGILSAVAIPMYIGQTINAKLTEVTNALSYAATAVAIYHHEAVLNGAVHDWPDCGSIAEIQTSLGLGLPADRISSASVDQATGVILFTIANIDSAVNGSTMSLTPSINPDSSVSWKWGGTILPRYLPKQ